MKIAYFTSNRTIFPPPPNEIAASSTVTLNIIEKLKQKHEITLYAAKGSNIPGTTIVDLNLAPIEMDSGTAADDWVTKSVIGMKQIYLGELLKNADNYDIIHIQTEPVYLGMPFVKLVNTPVLFTTHNAYHPFEKEIFSYFDNKLYLSGLSHNQVKHVPFKHPIPVIYNGLDIGKFKFSPTNEGYYLFLGRLARDKGIDAFLELAHAMKNNRFYIAGKGSNDYENLVKKSVQKNTNVQFLGMLARESDKWFRCLSGAKALIMPIDYEDSCPLVPLEAMACGTPVIAYDKGALGEQIEDAVTGYLVNPTKKKKSFSVQEVGIKGLMEAINTIENLSEEMYVNLRQNARKRIENKFNLDEMASQYEKLYMKIISNHKNLQQKQ